MQRWACPDLTSLLCKFIEDLVQPGLGRFEFDQSRQNKLRMGFVCPD